MGYNYHVLVLSTTLCTLLSYSGTFSWGKIFMIFVVEALTINIIPMNEATLNCLPLPAVQLSSNHKNIIHEVTKCCSNECSPPPRNLASRYYFSITSTIATQSCFWFATVFYMFSSESINWSYEWFQKSGGGGAVLWECTMNNFLAWPSLSWQGRDKLTMS